MTAEVLAEVPPLLAAHGRLAMATVVTAVGSTPRAAGARLLVLPDGTARGTVGGGKFESLVIAEARTLLERGGLPFTKSYTFTPDDFGAVCGGKASVMLEILERAPRLLIVGAGHCGRALARLAHAVGWELTVVDERAEQLDPAAFPAGTRLVQAAPDFSDAPLPAPGDFVAIISRGHVTDGLAFRRLRSAPSAYVGMMGSASKKKALFGELAAEGIPKEELDRVHIPIGLPIGAETPEEIAVAILAEIIKVRRERDSGGRA